MASGAFAAVKAAILASPDCTDTDRLLLCIPDIAQAQGWVELSAFLRKWFAAPASTDKDAAEPSFVEWDWLKIYPETATALTTIRNREYLFSPAAEAALFNQMKKDLDGVLPDVPVAFDHTVLPVEQLHERQFQFVTVDYGLSSEINGLVAGMGEFTIYAVAKGSVEPEDDHWRVTVTGVSLFVRDSFDYEGDQFLGSWDCGSLAATDLFSGGSVSNDDFRAYRERHGYGRDYYVYALLRPLDSFKEHFYVY